jgi:hypothetical protein
MSHRPVTQGRYYILGRICHLDNRQTKRSPGAKWGASHDLKFVVNRPAGGLAHVHEVHRRSDYLDRIDHALISLNTFTNVSRMIHETKRSPGAKWGALHDLKFVVNRPAGGLAHVHEVHRRFDYPGRIGNALISLNTFTDVSRVIPRIIYERLVAGHMVLAHHRRQASLEPAQ